jgi:hypothetical protein
LPDFRDPHDATFAGSASSTIFGAKPVPRWAPFRRGLLVGETARCRRRNDLRRHLGRRGPFGRTSGGRTCGEGSLRRLPMGGRGETSETLPPRSERGGALFP